MALLLPRRSPPFTSMAVPLLSASTPRRPRATAPSVPSISAPSPAPALGAAVQQTRSATYIPRPRRPYHFTQLIQLSDGSTFTVRTTSPHAMVKSARDTRNHLLWQPSEKSLRNVESDEAGKLAAFRERFGRGFDLDAPLAASASPPAADAGAQADSAVPPETGASPEIWDPPPSASFDMLGDLLSGYAEKSGMTSQSGISAKDIARAERRKRKKA